MSGDPRFRFGRNWRSFLDHHLHASTAAEAQRSLAEFLAPATLAGRTFLDIGCGSGLFSLAAQRLGASRVVSFDIDADSVACCRELREREGAPATWEVSEGSILDAAFVSRLAPADVVYSWGVLHHTGRMWDAVRAAGTLVAPGGQFYLALYNKVEGWGLHSDGRLGPSSFWAWEKRGYNRLPRVLQSAANGAAMGAMVVAYLLTLQNPFRKFREHREQHRGMSWSVDIVDWLGGYPYEAASPGEVFTFCHGELGLDLLRMKTTCTLQNNEFLFCRPANGAAVSPADLIRA